MNTIHVQTFVSKDTGVWIKLIATSLSFLDELFELAVSFSSFLSTIPEMRIIEAPRENSNIEMKLIAVTWS